MINTDSLRLPKSKWELKMRGCLGVALLFCALPNFLCGCFAQKNATQSVASASTLTGEQLAVYRGFLDALSSVGFKNLATTTIAFGPSEINPTSPCVKGLQFENSNDSGRSVHLLGPEIVEGRKLELVDSVQQSKLIERADNTKEPAPAASSERGFLVLSEIAFDKTHQFAMLKYNFICGAHCLTSQTYVMTKVGEQWKVNGRPCTMVAN